MSPPPSASTFSVPAEAAGARLDQWLASQLPGVSRSQVQRAIADDRVKVGGVTPGKAGQTLSAGDSVEWIPEETPATAPPAAEQIPLTVVYEDDDVCVVDKVAGMVVHPAPGHADGTLVNALMWHTDGLSEGRERDRPGIVHRIDRDTSGLLVVAKTDRAQAGLQAQFAAHTTHRVYRAVVYGPFLADTGTRETGFGRHPKDRKKMTGRIDGGRRACTHWRVLARGEALALVELRLETGRTHQIRVHMSESGHPVVADPIYGMKSPPSGGGGRMALELAAARRTPRLALHAAELGFVHPGTGEELRFTAPDPDDFAALVAVVEESAKG